MGSVRPTHAIAEFEVTALTNGKFKQNCYVVSHGPSKKSLLVDPGSEDAFLREYLLSHGLEPQKILLTHAHFDHLGAVDPLMKLFGIGCEMHALDKRLVRQAATYAYRFGAASLRVPQGLTFFENELSLDWGGTPVDVLPTPGHTAGSVAFSIGSAFVFTGDTLFRERIGPTTYPESDRAAIKKSVEKLLSTLPDECIIFPGHGRPWTIGEARSWWRLRSESPAGLAPF